MPQMLIVEIMASSTFISLSLLYVFIDADIVFMVFCFKCRICFHLTVRQGN